MALTPSKVPKKRKKSCERLVLAPREMDKKTHIGHKCASILNKTCSFVVFWCGMGVATPKSHQAARTSKFVAVKGERPARPWMRAESKRKLDHWEMDFRPLRSFRRIAAENPKCSRKVFCQKSAYLGFLRPKHGLLETKNDVWHRCHRLPQTCRRIRQPTAPKNAKLTKCCLIVSTRSIYSKFAQNF